MRTILDFLRELFGKLLLIVTAIGIIGLYQSESLTQDERLLLFLVFGIAGVNAIGLQAVHFYSEETQLLNIFTVFFNFAVLSISVTIYTLDQLQILGGVYPGESGQQLLLVVNEIKNTSDSILYGIMALLITITIIQVYRVYDHVRISAILKAKENAFVKRVKSGEISLSVGNPFDYVRLFSWIWFSPQKLKVYESSLSEHKKKELRKQGIWLTSALSWLPLAVFAIWKWFSTDTSTLSLLLAMLYFSLWIVTGLFGHQKRNYVRYALVLTAIIAFITPSLLFFQSASFYDADSSFLFLAFIAFVISLVFAFPNAIISGVVTLSVIDNEADDSKLQVAAVVGYLVTVGITTGWVVTAFGGAIESGVVASLLVGISLRHLAQTEELEKRKEWVFGGGTIAGISTAIIYFLLTERVIGSTSLIGIPLLPGIILGLLAASINFFLGTFMGLNDRAKNYEKAELVPGIND